MKKSLKILLIIVLSLIFSQNCPAKENIQANLSPQESYLVLLNVPADTAMSSNVNILSAEILTTLYNEKNQILVKALSEGIVRLYIAVKDDIAVIEFTIKPCDKEEDDSYSEPKSNIIKSILKLDRITDKPLKTEPSQKKNETAPELRGEH